MDSIDSFLRPAGTGTSLRRWLALPLLCAVTAAAPGCVSKGKYQGALGERDDFMTRTESLENQVDSLEGDKNSLETLVDELEADKADLQGEVESLNRQNSELGDMVRQMGLETENLGSEMERQEREAEQFQATYDALVNELRSEVSAGQIEIEQLRDGLRVNVAQEILFESGSVALDVEGKAVLLRVCDQLKQTPYQIIISGHTDNVQIRGQLAQRFPTNWELAGARAARVVRLFEEDGIDGDRLLVVSLGETHPVASNQDAEGRAKNRRIEIRLRPVVPEDSAS